MKDTLKMMKNIVTGEEKELTQEELIKQYQKEYKGNILAYMYISNFGIISMIADNWYKLDDTDKASFCLQELDKCLRNYKFDTSAKFISYFQICFKNRLRMETEAISVDKRKVVLNQVHEEGLIDSSFKEDDYFQDEESILNQYNLTPTEKKHCRLINRGYTRKEIAAYMNITVQGIYNINNNVRKKILNSF